MSAPKHTQGPFAVKERPILMVVAPDDLVLCEITDLGDMAGAKEGEEYANALLFAASADLLEATNPDLLDRVADLCEAMGHEASASGLRVCAANQRAAIAKATGEAGQ